MVIPARVSVPALRRARKGLGDESAGGCEDYGGIEWMGRRVFGASDPCGAETLGQFAMNWSTGEDVDLAPLVACQL